MPALSMAAKRDSMKLAASRTDALAIVGKKTEKDDSTSAAEKYFGEKMLKDPYFNDFSGFFAPN